MTEIKSDDPNTVPKAEAPEEPQAAAAFDPGQTRLLPPKTAFEKEERENNHGMGRGIPPGMRELRKPWHNLLAWFRNLSQSAIIWISFSIILIFLVVLILLIVQSRPKSKTLKPAAFEQLNEAGAAGGSENGRMSSNKPVRQIDKTILILTDDEFAGQAPMSFKSGGPVISAANDPELAALVDALKNRMQISADSKVAGRGNIITRVIRGEFRGFKINVEEKIEDQKILSKAVTVTLPKKGFVKTVNRMLESIRECDLERFTRELQEAGLEIVWPPLQPGSNVMNVQLRAAGIFGKAVDADFLISGKSVGKIYLGMPTARLENMLLSSYVVLKRKVLVNDIYHDVYKVLDQSNEPLFFVYENQGRIWGISIISENFKTEKGVGIGSGLRQIRTNYLQVNVGISEKKIPFVKLDGVEGLFVIQGEGLDVTRRVFPAHTKVVSILIGKSLEFE